MDLAIEVSTPPTLPAVRRIARIVEESLRSLVPEESAAAVQLAVAELCNNAVQHGSSLEAGARLRTRIEILQDSIRVVLVHRGAPFDATRLQGDGHDDSGPAGVPSRGRGLSIVHHLMDAVEYETLGGENIVRMVKRFAKLPSRRGIEGSRTLEDGRR